MADFNVDTPQVPNQAPPPQGVVDNSVAQGINLFSDVAGTVGKTFMQSAANGAKQAALDKGNHVLDTYEQNLLRVSDLHDQGVMSQDTARRRYRVMTAQVLANNPALRDDINSVYQKVISTTGLGKNIDVGTAAEQQFDAIAKDAVSAGMIPASIDPHSEQGRQLVGAYQQMKQHLTMVAAAKTDLDYKRSQVGYQSDVVQLAGAKQSLATGAITQKTAQLNLLEKQAEVQSRANLTGAAGNFGKVLNAKLVDIQNRFQSGALDAKNAILEIDRAVADINQITVASGANAGGDYITNLLKPMQISANALKDFISGKTDADTAQNELDASVSRTSLQLIHNHPEALKYIAVSKLLPNVPSPVLATMSSKAVDLLNLGSTEDSANGTTRPPDLTSHDSNKQDVKSYIGAVKGGLASYAAGTLKDPDAVKELSNNISSAVNSLATYGPTTSSPKELNDLVTLIATPEFAKFKADGKLPLSPELKDKLVNVMDNYYNGKILPLVAAEFQNKMRVDPNPLSKIGGPAAEHVQKQLNVKAQPTTYIHTVLSGDSVKFVPNDPKNEEAASRAQELSKDVGPILNKMIKANANLSGGSYQTVYEQLMAQLDPPRNIPNMPQSNPVDLGIKPLDLNNPDYGPPDAPGMIKQGNIDLNARPVVDNKDGSFSTVRSISIGTDKGEVLIPTVIGNKVVSNEDAISHYEKTGENLGVFKSVAAANLYAERLHNEQAKLYSKRK